MHQEDEIVPYRTVVGGLGLIVAAGAILALEYPATKRGDTIDTMHGVRVPDPYRWLEDLDRDDTKEWVDQQDRLAREYLGAGDLRSAIQVRLAGLWRHDRYSDFSRAGAKYFYLFRGSSADQSALFFSDLVTGRRHVLVDPTSDLEPGQSLGSVFPSPDGSVVAYQIRSSGSDRREVAFVSVNPREPLPDTLRGTRPDPIAWTALGDGVYYNRFVLKESAAEMGMAQAGVFLHVLGTPPSQDVLIYSEPDRPELTYSALESADGRFLILNIRKGADRRNQLILRRLQHERLDELVLGDQFQHEFEFVGNEQDTVFVRTNQGAVRGRLIGMELDDSSPSSWTTIVPESDDVLVAATYVDGLLVLSYLRDSHTVVRLMSIRGTERVEVALPALGRAFGFRRDSSATSVLYTFTSFTQPHTVYELDLETARSTAVAVQGIDADFDQIATHLEFYPGSDGQMIPIYISHRRDGDRSREQPTQLRVYGGFGIPVTPSFSVPDLLWMEMGGLLAMPGVRGGGEYGRDWHHAATKTRKQVTFSDTIRAAEWLIEQGYTSSSKLAVTGASNGALVAAVCILQRPRLFRAAVLRNGVLDMLRFPRFTIGWAWTPEFGSPDVADEFQALVSYSPVHNAKPNVEYPSVLVTAGLHDDRVVPLHSFKFAAALQFAQESPNPVILRVRRQGGHLGSGGLQSLIDKETDVLVFLARELGVQPP